MLPGYIIFYMWSPLFQGSKVIGQTNNCKLVIFNTWLQIHFI